MAEKEKKEKKGKKGKKEKKGLAAIATVIIAVVLIIVLLASFIFAIFEAIIEIIKNIIINTITGLLNFLAHPIKCTVQALGGLGNFLSSMTNQDFNGDSLELTQPKQLIEVSQDQFNEMKNQLDEAISRNVAGLDDAMLKKMLLAYYTGRYSRNTDIIIELTDEEKQAYWNDNTIYSPFKVKIGRELNQLNINLFEAAANRIGTFFETLFGGGNVFDSEVYEKEKEEREEKQDTYYVHAKGVLKFINEDNEELVYYNEEVIKQLYNEFEKYRYGASSDYALSVWDYLSSKCYTDGEYGMKMYSHQTVEEELVEWIFEDDDAGVDSFGEILDFGDQALSGIAINKQIIDSEYLTYDTEGIFNGGLLDTAKKKYEMQDIDYYSLVSQYLTPVEFMVDLLNISSSKEFVNSFIEKVIEETEVTLKIYKISNSYSEEETEVTKEKTTVLAEAAVTAEVVSYDRDDDEATGYIKGNKGIKVESIELSDGTAMWGIANALNINIKFSRIPSNVCAFHVEVTFAATGETKNIIVGDSIFDGVDVFFSHPLDDEIDIQSWFTTRYKERENTATIRKYTTKLITETKLDIAVENVKTWYGNIEYENNVKTNILYETINNSGRRVKINTDSPNMIEKTKEKEVYNKDNSNKDTIFARKKIEDFAWTEIGSRIEKWYANLKADEIAYWIVPGGNLTHSLYTQIDKDKGYQLSNEDELLNVRLTYAMENGPADWWINRHYLPVKMTCEAKKYEIGYLYVTIDNELVKGTSTVSDNTDIFLSLLKNDTGVYSKEASYNPNGKEVRYKTIYNSKDRVGTLLVNGAEMLFDLLGRSRSTEGLTNVMRYILYKYTDTDNYGVTEFNYDIINREDFVTVG